MSQINLNVRIGFKRMKKTLEIINRMQNEGLFKKYAIGGGIATLFYIEPIATFDLDIFFIPEKNEEIILSLSPLYEWLKYNNYNPVKEHVVIEGIPVQFIPVYYDLVYEAVLRSLRKKYEDITTYVLRPEYLIAIMLKTNRSKDRERLIKMLDQTNISNELLEKILKKFDLTCAYKEFREKFYE